MTCINFDRFQLLFFRAAPYDDIISSASPFRKFRSGEYRDESYGDLLLTGCQATESLLIDRVM